MSILLIPLAYKESALSFLKTCFLKSFNNGFAWKDYLTTVFYVYYCCALIYILITIFYIENIHLHVDLIKNY